VAHFWSLAAEEQFYLVFPFLAVFSLGVLGGRLGLGVVAAAGLMLSIGLQPTLDGMEGVERFVGMSRIYAGSDVRAAEFLIGCLLAVIFSYQGARHWLTTSRWVTIAGIASFAVITYCLFTVKFTAGWLYERGGFAMIGLVFAIIICSLTQSNGLMVRMLGTEILRWLGERSYGMYVYHFPIMAGFAGVTHGWSVLLRILLLVGLTLITASVSYKYMEQPIRRGYRSRLR
jgi:peptidoglycan/LPS O-acetylase OafA/YrhL